MSRNDARESRNGGCSARRIRSERRKTSTMMSIADADDDRRYDNGSGSPGGRGGGEQRNGASASAVTTHGEIELAKFLARNGPSGCDSHDWMSRADQSLSRHAPNRWRSASSIN